MKDGGAGGLETAPVIISVSRHRGTWTSGAHVSLHSFAATRSREGGPLCVCVHFFFFMEASACICEQFCLLSGWCLNTHAQMCVWVLLNLLGTKRHGGGVNEAFYSSIKSGVKMRFLCTPAHNEVMGEKTRRVFPFCFNLAKCRPLMYSYIHLHSSIICYLPLQQWF